MYVTLPRYLTPMRPGYDDGFDRRREQHPRGNGAEDLSYGGYIGGSGALLEALSPSMVSSPMNEPWCTPCLSISS